jgi:(p)ppGpp synthase/HD superfamily hydrolase
MPPSPRIEVAAARSPLVAEALAVATEAHAGQIRNGSCGKPYIEHPVAVADLLERHGFGEQVLAAALLHDVVEDSDTTVAELRERFGDVWDVSPLLARLAKEGKTFAEFDKAKA